MSEKIVLMDGYSILNRAFYGVPELTNADGLHTNGIYGFLNILFKILEEEKPGLLCVAFDVKEPTFRHKMYAEYKGTRKPMPQELREQVCFVLFDLEEAGLWGSSSYRSKHKKESNDQIVLNVDCVGDGDLIMLFPKKKIRKNLELMEKLKQSCGSYGNKQVTIHEEGFCTYPSDQSNFPYGVGICALRQGKFGPYLSRIHTPKDTILEEANVQLLSKTLTEIIRNY